MARSGRCGDRMPYCKGPNTFIPWICVSFSFIRFGYNNNQMEKTAAKRFGRQGMRSLQGSRPQLWWSIKFGDVKCEACLCLDKS